MAMRDRTRRILLSVTACLLAAWGPAGAGVATAAGSSAASTAGSASGSAACVVDDRWSFFGGFDDRSAFREALNGPGTAARRDRHTTYLWGYWESPLCCGRRGPEGFLKPGTMVVTIHDGRLVGAEVYFGSAIIQLVPSATASPGL